MPMDYIKKMKKTYSQFLAEKIELWASLGIKSEHWDKLLVAILPALIRELKAEVRKKRKVEQKDKKGKYA